MKPAFLLKVTLLHEDFSRFLNCTNGTESRKASHIFVKRKLIQVNDKKYCQIFFTMTLAC